MQLHRLWIVLAICACERSSEVKHAPAPDLQIVSPGNEPRRLLRYQVPAGTRRSLEVAIEVDLSASDLGGPLPTLVMTLDLAVDRVLADGGMQLRATVVDVVARERMESSVPAAALAGPLEPMKGVAIAATLAPSGRLGKAQIAGIEKLPEAVASQLTGLTSSFEHVMMPLPAEPVGIGAVWRNSLPIDQSAMKLVAVNSVALTAIDGDRIALAIDTQVHGEDQQVTQGSLAIGVKDVTGTGHGISTIDLRTLAIASELTAELRSQMTAPGEAEPTAMRMKSVTKVTAR